MSKAKTTAGLPFSSEDYVKAQNTADFKPGQRVRVLRAAESFESGWDNDWIPEMDAFVGKEATISPGFGGCPASYGIPLLAENGDEKYAFPYYVLEVVK